MHQVFDYITVWRANFSASRPTIALVGHKDKSPLNVNALIHNFKQNKMIPDDMSDRFAAASVLQYYIGNLFSADKLVQSTIINTDDKPYIEYLAPIAKRKYASNETMMFNGELAYDFF